MQTLIGVTWASEVGPDCVITQCREIEVIDKHIDRPAGLSSSIYSSTASGNYSDLPAGLALNESAHSMIHL